MSQNRTITPTESYYDVLAISNSVMGLYEDRFHSFVNYWINQSPFPQESTSSLTLGSVVDVLITSPQTFNAKFITYTGEVPTGLMLKFVEELYAICLQRGDFQNLPFQEAYDATGFKRDNLETVTQKFNSFTDYFNFLVNREGKEVITAEQEIQARQIVEELKSNVYTSHFVDIESSGSIEVINQLEIYSEYNYVLKEDSTQVTTIPIKGAIDRVIINHEKKMIVPIDFKTTSQGAYKFHQSYCKYRYYRQASFYLYLLNIWRKSKGLEDYSISPFIFIVCSTLNDGMHCVYRTTEQDMKAAEDGGFLQNTTTRIKGWRNILDEIGYHTIKRNWKFPYDILVNNGILSLNAFV